MKSVEQSESPVKSVSSAGTEHQPPNAGRWIKLGDAAGTLTKRLLMQGYAQGALSVETTQSLVDKLGINEK